MSEIRHQSHSEITFTEQEVNVLAQGSGIEIIAEHALASGRNDCRNQSRKREVLVDPDTTKTAGNFVCGAVFEYDPSTRTAIIGCQEDHCQAGDVFALKQIERATDKVMQTLSEPANS